MTLKYDKIQERPEFNIEKLMVDLIMLSGVNPKLTPAVNRLLEVVQVEWASNPPQSLLDFNEQQLLDYFLYLMVAVQQNTDLAIKQKKTGNKVTVISTVPALEQQLLGKFVLYALYLKNEFKDEFGFNPGVVETELIRLSRVVDNQILINFFRIMDKAVPQKNDYLTETKEIAQLAAGVLHLNIQSAQENNPGGGPLGQGKIMKGAQRIMQIAKIISEGDPIEFFKAMDLIFTAETSYLNDMNLLLIRQALTQLDALARDRFVQMLVGLKNYPISSRSWLKINDYWHDLFTDQQWLKIHSDRKLRTISERGLEEAGHSLKDSDAQVEGNLRDMIDDLNDLVTGIDEKTIEDKILAEFAVEIGRERSSGMSQDGHKFPLKAEESPLAAMIEEVRISRNKETGKPAIGIACNVNFRLKNGHTFYSKLNAEGELLIRAMDNNGRELRVVKKGEEPRIKDQLIGELNRVALGKLKMIYVRQKPSVVKALPENNLLIDALPVNDASAVVAEIAEMVSVEIKEVVGAGENAVAGSMENSSQQLMFPGMIEQGWSKQGKESPMKMDLTEKEKVLRAEISRKERIKIESNMARVRDLFLKIKTEMLPKKSMVQGQLWPEWPELSESLKADLEKLVLHVMVKINGEEYYEALDAEKAYEKLQKNKLTLGQIFVRSKRAYAQALPYVLGNKTVFVDENTEKRIWYTQRKEMSDQARLKMDIFQSGESGEEMNLADKNKILYFEIEDFSKDGQKTVARKIFENIENGRAGFLMGLGVEKEIRECTEEMKAKAKEKYLTGQEVQAGRYEEIVGRLDKAMERKLSRAKESLEEIRLMAKAEVKEVIRNDGGVRDRATLSLPANGFKFGQTFNQGAFKAVADLIKMPKESSK